MSIHEQETQLITAPIPTPPPYVAPPPPAAAAGYDAFAHRPPFRARRNSVRRWTAAALGAGALMLAAAAAITWLGTPAILQQWGLGLTPEENPLRLKNKPVDRRELDNGSELFAVSGQVTNPSATAQRVPDIRAELRDAHCRLVFSWTITPSQRSLSPGGSIEFNSAKLDVPANSKLLELSFADAGPAAQQTQCGATPS